MEGQSNGSSGDHEDIPHPVVNEEGTPADIPDVGDTAPAPEAAPAAPRVVVKHFHFNILGSNAAESAHVLRSLMHAVATHQASGVVQPQLSIQSAPGTAMHGSGSPGALTQGSTSAVTAMQGSTSAVTAMQGSTSAGAAMQGSISAGTAMQGSTSAGISIQGSSSVGSALQGSSFPGTPLQGSGTAMPGSPLHFMQGPAGSFMQGSPGPSVSTPPGSTMQGAVGGPSSFTMGSPLAAGPSFSASEPTTSGNQTVQLLAQALLQRKVGRPSRAQAAVQRAALEAATSMVSSAGPASTRPLCFKCNMPRADHVLASCGHHVCSSCIAVWPIAQGHCPCGTPCNSTHLVRLNQ